MTGPRDWDKELAEIDRLMAKDAGKAPAPEGQPAAVPARAGGAAPASRQAAAAPVPARPAGGRREALGLWLLALLGPLGAAALAVWPYPKGCGTMLAVYLVGVAAVAGAGIWTMRAAWLARRGRAHVFGLATLLAALVLAALEILPRIGYAATALAWGCTT